MEPSSFQHLTQESAFCFSCTQCGECCFDQLVLLEPSDLFFLSRYGGLPGVESTKELFSEGIVELIECDSEWRCSLVMPRFQRGTKCRFLSPKLTDKGRVLG